MIEEESIDNDPLDNRNLHLAGEIDSSTSMDPVDDTTNSTAKKGKGKGKTTVDHHRQCLDDDVAMNDTYTGSDPSTSACYGGMLTIDNKVLDNKDSSRAYLETILNEGFKDCGQSNPSTICSDYQLSEMATESEPRCSRSVESNGVMNCATSDILTTTGESNVDENQCKQMSVPNHGSAASASQSIAINDAIYGSVHAEKMDNGGHEALVTISDKDIHELFEGL